jgi:hypothetical protein
VDKFKEFEYFLKAPYIVNFKCLFDVANKIAVGFKCIISSISIGFELLVDEQNSDFSSFINCDFDFRTCVCNILPGQQCDQPIPAVAEHGQPRLPHSRAVQTAEEH